MTETHIIPNDKLFPFHTDENCFCYPGEWRGITHHRREDMISQLNPDIITGYVVLHGD